MTNGQIQCFLAVVEEGSYAKAANSLFISQPAISKSVSRLEEELDVELLERRTGIVTTTVAGAMLYQFLNRTKDEFHMLLKDINDIKNELSGTILIGCPETWNPTNFYDSMIEHFARNYPSIKLEIESHRLPSLMTKLQNGKLDIIMTHEFYPQVQYGLATRRLTDTGCGILYSNAYFKNISSLADLKDVDFLHFDSDIEKRFSTVVKRICNEYGFSPTFKNCGQFPSALFNMSCGKGVMFFTDWDNAVANSSYSYLPLNYRSPVNLIYRVTGNNAKIHLTVDELIRLFNDSNMGKGV